METQNITNKRGLAFTMHKVGSSTVMQAFREIGINPSIGGGNIGVGPTHFEWEYADAQTARFVTDGDIKHAKGKGQVAWLLEPYELHPENYHEVMGRIGEFDAVLSHMPSQLDKIIWYPYGGSWIPFQQWGASRKKDKMVSMILSDKNTTSGHILRREVAEKLESRVDVFQNFPDKIDALAPYKFSIVIESEKSRYYFTEKLIDCLCVGTIPIYWGSPITTDVLSNFFDPLGIIAVDGLEEIERCVDEASDMLYDSKRTSIQINIGACHDFAVCEDWMWRVYPELFQ